MIFFNGCFINLNQPVWNKGTSTFRTVTFTFKLTLICTLNMCRLWRFVHTVRSESGEAILSLSMNEHCSIGSFNSIKYVVYSTANITYCIVSDENESEKSRNVSLSLPHSLDMYKPQQPKPSVTETNSRKNKRTSDDLVQLKGWNFIRQRIGVSWPFITYSREQYHGMIIWLTDDRYSCTCTQCTAESRVEELTTTRVLLKHGSHFSGRAKFSYFSLTFSIFFFIFSNF